MKKPSRLPINSLIVILEGAWADRYIRTENGWNNIDDDLDWASLTSIDEATESAKWEILALPGHNLSADTHG